MQVFRQNYVSIHLMLLFIASNAGIALGRALFQYISCYCLSSWLNPSKCKKQTFQYISCYCLSAFFFFVVMLPSSFNTSHVTVYPISGATGSDLQSRFNTSHVTVYPVGVAIVEVCSKVSIHLMLLFIAKCSLL